MRPVQCLFKSFVSLSITNITFFFNKSRHYSSLGPSWGLNIVILLARARHEKILRKVLLRKVLIKKNGFECYKQHAAGIGKIALGSWVRLRKGRSNVKRSFKVFKQ